MANKKPREDKNEKYRDDMKSIVETTGRFSKEENAVKMIIDHVNKNLSLEPESYKNEFWKHYRAFRLKEFLFQMRERIATEKDSVDTMVNKAIDMIDDPILWRAANTAGGSDKKLIQRYYSKHFEEAFKEVLGSSEWNNKSLDEIKAEGIKKRKANLPDIKYHLDHALPRAAVKHYCEFVCDTVVRYRKKEALAEIDRRIDVLLPFMFGVVVTKKENTMLDVAFNNMNKKENYESWTIDDLKKLIDDTYGKAQVKLIEIEDSDGSKSVKEVEAPSGACEKYDEIVVDSDIIAAYDTESRTWQRCLK